MESICTPTFTMLTDSPVIARSGPLEIRAIVVLVGCKEDLSLLVEKERSELASNVLPAYILEEPSFLEPAVRSRLTERINAELGRPLVTDVLIYQTSLTEYEPAW
jgi:hypothetical protein